MSDIAAEFNEKVSQFVESQIKVYPCKSNRASMMGDNCDRRVVYWRTDWQHALAHKVDTEFLFRDGRVHEAATLNLLREAGFQIIEQQRPFEWKEYGITGQIDAKILIPGTRDAIPVEVKGYAGHTWVQLNTMEDFLSHSASYVRRAPIQLQCYLWMDNKPGGLFALKNKWNGRVKFVFCPLSPELGEVAVSQAIRVNDHMAAGTLPDRIPYDPEECDGCAFAHICLKDVQLKPAEIGSDELEEWARRYLELKPTVKEAESLWQKIKDAVKEKPVVLTSSYKIVGKWVEKKGFEVKPSKSWKTQILDLDE